MYSVAYFTPYQKCDLLSSTVYMLFYPKIYLLYILVDTLTFFMFHCTALDSLLCLSMKCLSSRVIWLQHIGWVAMGTDSDVTVEGLIMSCGFQTFSLLIWFCSDTICLTVHENLVKAFSVSQAYLVLPVCNVFDLIHQDYPVNANTKHFSSCLQCHYLIYNSFHSFILSLIE